MRLTRLLSALPLLLAACSSGDDKPSTIRLQGSLEDCVNIQEICTLSEPSQCFDYCADEDPGMPPDGTGCGVVSPDGQTEPGSEGGFEVVECDDSPCIVTQAEGQDVQICYPPDCTVSYDAETETETIECPPGGTEPGEPTDPTEPCDADGAGGFLKYAEGSCGADGAEATCAIIPDACPELYGPVCGCDGVTYANACFADGAAASILHQGECDRGEPLPL